MAIDVSTSPAPFGIVAIDFRMPFNPAVVSASASLNDGFLQTWGTAYANGTTSFLAAASGGLAPVNTSSTRLNTVRLTISPSAVVGTTMPLTFSSLHFNEGSPSVSFTAGSVHVSSTLAVDSDAGARFGVEAPRPNPVRTEAALSYALASPGTAKLAVYDVAGARRKTLVDDTEPAGTHALRWDGRDDRGERLEAGVYFLRLTTSGRAAVRRFAIVR